MFENLVRFSGEVLLSSTTANTISGRGLGTNSKITAKNTVHWIGNGNNTAIDDQMARRLVLINLNAKKANIQDRDYRHPHLEEFLKANRGVAIGHVLTMIQYWIATGKKPFMARKRGGFQHWVEQVGGVIQACELEGFLEGQSVESISEETIIENTFVQAWHVNYQLDLKRARDMFDWAFGADLEIISGKSDDHKRSRFLQTMRKLNGNTFSVEVLRTDQELTSEEFVIRQEIGANGVSYKLVPVPGSTKVVSVSA